jgi:hypothetical protein
LSLEKYAVEVTQIERGIGTIKKRYQSLDLLAICAGVIFITSMVALYLQQDFVYGFFGLTNEIKQLHVPMSVDKNLTQLQDQPDYFLNLLSWFGWLILKLLLSFIGAFFVIKFLKRFKFFAQRFKSIILKFVGWLIAFICLWSVLTYVQYDLRDKNKDAFSKVLYYENNLQQSELAQYLQESKLDRTVQAYLLAQTALLHQPVDKDAAIPYVLDLVKAEKNNLQFIEYGFKPEQLWTMQHQLYGKTLTPLAQSVERQVKQANQISIIVQYFLIILAGSSAIVLILLILLSRNLKHRIHRIEQQMIN